MQWRNAVGQIESGYLAIREGRSAIAVKRDNYQLFERLQQWKARNGSEPVLPTYLEELPLPNIGTVTSSSLNTLQSDVQLIWPVVFPTNAFRIVVLGLSMLGGFFACLSTCLAYFVYLLPTLIFADATISTTTPSHPQPKF